MSSAFSQTGAARHSQAQLQLNTFLKPLPPPARLPALQATQPTTAALHLCPTKSTFAE